MKSGNEKKKEVLVSFSKFTLNCGLIFKSLKCLKYLINDKIGNLFVG